jgi:DNA transformation protein
VSLSEAFKEQVQDLLHGLGPIQFRRMFGGAGVYREGLIFGLVDEDVLYLKVDGENRAAFEAAGSRPFTYTREGREQPLSYWRMPDAGLDDPDEALHWARLALEAAHRAVMSKSQKRRKS